jgi:hypothetical protein
MGKYATNYIAELLLVLLGIFISIASFFFDSIPNYAAWSVSIYTAIISLSVLIIKQHQFKLAEKLNNDLYKKLGEHLEILSIISSLKGIQSEHATNIMEKTLASLREIASGKIHLDQPTYYANIDACILNALPRSEVYAVNIMDIEKSDSDSRQNKYLNDNISAAARGVIINRIYILNKESTLSAINNGKATHLSSQIDSKNINVNVVWDTLVKNFGDIDGSVRFEKPEERLYIDYTDRANPSEVSHADLILDEKEIERIKNQYKNLISYSFEPKSLNDLKD